MPGAAPNSAERITIIEKWHTMKACMEGPIFFYAIGKFISNHDNRYIPCLLKESRILRFDTTLLSIQDL